jgi:hypothetical protein
MNGQRTIGTTSEPTGQLELTGSPSFSSQCPEKAPALVVEKDPAVCRIGDSDHPIRKEHGTNHASEKGVAWTKCRADLERRLAKKGDAARLRDAWHQRPLDRRLAGRLGTQRLRPTDQYRGEASR